MHNLQKLTDIRKTFPAWNLEHLEHEGGYSGHTILEATSPVPNRDIKVCSGFWADPKEI
jgi:hypothetical protein